MPPGSRICRVQRALTLLIICCVAVIFIISISSTIKPKTTDHNRCNDEGKEVDFEVSNVKQLEKPLNRTRVFLIETSGSSQLKLRQACAVESAAFHHPNQTVTLYSLVPLSENVSLHQILLSIPNVKFEILDLTELFDKTPMEEWHRKGVINESSYPTEHLSDAVRIALLWKYGGVYLDTDVITVRPIIGLQNALALEYLSVASNAILVFDQWSSFIYQCMIDYVAKYTKDVWGMQGPLLMTRVLQRACSMEDISRAVNRPGSCQGVTILASQSFFPISYWKLDKFFYSAFNRKSNIIGAYTVHLWNKLTKKRIVTPGTGTFLETLAEENCPATYKIMQKCQMV